MNRKHVNDEVARIVRNHEETIRSCPSNMTVILMLGEMIRELQAHVDATVEQALAESAYEASRGGAW